MRQNLCKIKNIYFKTEIMIFSGFIRITEIYCTVANTILKSLTESKKYARLQLKDVMPLIRLDVTLTMEQPAAHGGESRILACFR